MNRNEILSVLGDFKRNCATQYGIVELGLFGSAAREAAGPNSDVDVCVKTQTPNPLVLVHLKTALEERLLRRVDLVRMRDSMNPFLRSKIEKEGIYV